MAPTRTIRLALLALVGALAFALAVPVPGAVAGEVIAEDSVHGGVYWSNNDPASTPEALAQATGRKTSLAGMFIEPWDVWTTETLANAWRWETTPFVNVSLNHASAAGNVDTGAISFFADQVQAFLDYPEFSGGPPRSLIIAPLQEANGSWTRYGCDPANFKAAFRAYVDIFRQRGIDETKVRWAFAPNGWTSPGCGSLADYYPGDGYVDILSFSAYNFGTCVGSGWDSVYYVMNDPISELKAINPTKPIVVAQTAAPRSAGCGGDQAQWVRDLFASLAADPQVAGFVWFNLVKETDWRISAGSWVSPGWSDGVKYAGTDYAWPLSDWFTPGPLAVKPATPVPAPCPNGQICDTVAFVDTGGGWDRWVDLGSTAEVDSFFFGNPGDVPFMGDWDGDGVATPGLYRRSDGFVYLRNSNTQGVADYEFFFGDPGDFPVVGDWDGDGLDTVSIYRQSEGRVYVMNRLGADGGGLGEADFDFLFGNPGDAPFVGDFDGDGMDSVGLYRRSTGFVYFRNGLSSGVAEFEFFYGDPGDVIVAGDWDGDGDDTVAVYRPGDGRFYVNLENAPGAADHTIYVGSYPFATTSDLD